MGSRCKVQLQKGEILYVMAGLHIVYGGVVQDLSAPDEYLSDCIIVLTIIRHFGSFPIYYHFMKLEDDAYDEDGAAYDVDTEDSDSLEFYGPGKELIVLKLTDFGHNFLDGEMSLGINHDVDDQALSDSEMKEQES